MKYDKARFIRALIISEIILLVFSLCLSGCSINNERSRKEGLAADEVTGEITGAAIGEFTGEASKAEKGSNDAGSIISNDSENKKDIKATVVPFSNPQFKNPKYAKFLETLDPKTQIPKEVKPLFDYWIRDTYITLGGDRFYYATGTTRSEDPALTGGCNDGIRMWRSADLKKWDYLGLVWSFEKDGTWQKEFKYELGSDGKPVSQQKYRAIWAPEIHYIKNNFYITASINWPKQKPGDEESVTFLLKSKTGKAEGPYEGVGDGPMTSRIDSSLFQDDDGTVYYIWQDGRIARMKDDMSGFAETPRNVIQKKFTPEPYCEGVFIFKEKSKYYMALSIWTMQRDGKLGYFPAPEQYKISYDCVIAEADNIYGPYSTRYTSITGGGHNNFFKDKDGNWWATMFGNPVADSYAPFYAKPAIIPMKFDENSRIYPNPYWFKK